MMESDTAHELVRTAGNGRLDTLKRLRDAGADANGVGKLYPAYVATDRRQVDCLRVLLDHGAHMGMSYPESYWGSALYAAAALNVLPCLRLMLELVNDPDTTNTCHETAWHEAANRGQLGCARLLRVHGTKGSSSNTEA